MVLLDATALSLLVNPTARPPINPSTGAFVDRAHDRYRLLAEELQRQNETIVIAAPALAEVLVLAADAGPSILSTLNKSSRFKIADFDQRAAVELAAMTREAERAGDKRSGATEPYQKIKVDRQIIAIARVHGVRTVYSDDRTLSIFGALIGIPVVKSWEMPLPEAPPPDLFSAFAG